MFLALTALDIRENSRLNAASIGKIQAQQQIEVEGQGIIQDGWIWFKLKGRNGWVGERTVDGSTISLSWWAAQPPPAIPVTSLDTRAGMPPQPASFTHQQLITAVRQAATMLGTPRAAADWMTRGRLDWISIDPSLVYGGASIANLPYLNRQMKIEIINQLNRGLAAAANTTAAASSSSAAASSASGTASSASQPATTTAQVPTGVDLPAQDYNRVLMAAFAITRVFEGGGFGSYNNYDRGIVSYGIMQFTLGSGSLGEVLQEYLKTANTDVAAQLQNQYAERVRNKDAALREDQRLRELLIEAAKELPMQAAQYKIATVNYWDVMIKMSVQSRGNWRLPLSYALLFDMAINFGPGHGYIRRAEESFGLKPMSRVGTNGITEEQLTTRIAELRRDAHYRQADRDNLPGLKVRGDFWVNITQQGDWQLQGDRDGLVYPKKGRSAQVRRPGF